MKNIIVSALIIISMSIPTASAQSKSSSITFTIKNIPSDKGSILVALYNTEETFLKKPFRTFKTAAQKGEISNTFAEIPAGTYAISTYHDKNDNGKLDTNFVGMPTEKYAASNGAKGILGPPKWEDASFKVKNASISKDLIL